MASTFSSTTLKPTVAYSVALQPAESTLAPIQVSSTTLDTTTAAGASLAPTVPQKPAVVAHPAVSTLPPHQVVAATKPVASAPLSTAAKVGIGAAVVAGLGLGLKFL